MLQSKKITLIFGKICSGKSTYADALCYVIKAKRVTVSDIVKRVSGKVTRSELQTTAHMDQDIVNELCVEVDKYDRIVIDGIRQSSIAIGLVKKYGIDNIDMIWLEVPDDIRRYRFYDRSISKDDMTFEDANASDDKLGLAELQSSLKDLYIKINN